MSNPQIVLRLVTRGVTHEASISAWVDELGTLVSAGRSCALELAGGGASPEVVARCADKGIEVRDEQSPGPIGEDALMVVVDAAVRPGPRVVQHLSDATILAPGSVVTARSLPLEDSHSGPPAVALDAAAAKLLLRDNQHGFNAATSGPEPLVAAARARDVPVELAPAATVYRNLKVVLIGDSGDDLGIRSVGNRTVRVVYGDPVELDPTTEGSDDLHVARPTGHPAALETSIGRLLDQLGLDKPEPDLTSRPFLTVVTRTQGRRLQSLAETLTCLAAQTVQDFEVVLACHRVSEQELKGVERILTELPQWLVERIRILRVDRPGRAAPLNDAFAAARGRYAVMLDDDDTVLSNWVETFRDLEADHVGQVLRTVAVQQDVEGVEVIVGGGSVTCPVAVKDPVATWPGKFRFVDHLFGNFSPCMTVAFPRGVFIDLGERFDESLNTTEDWEYLMRAASIVGVANAPVVTSVYRWWIEGDSSRAMHDRAAWSRTRDEILHTMEQRLIILPPGNARRVDEMNTEIHHAWHEIGVAAEASNKLNDRLVDTLDHSSRTGGLLQVALDTTRRLTETSQRLARTVEQQEATIARLRKKLKHSAP